MFAVEIELRDGSSEPEVKLLRRPYGVVGSGEYSHVLLKNEIVEGEEARFYRSPGAEFICVHRRGDQVLSREVTQLEKSIRLGKVNLQIFALDSDVQFPRELSADRAGVAVLKQAMRAAPKAFPALLLRGPEEMGVSFGTERSLLIGRGNDAALRIDLPEVSTEHARVIREDDGYVLEDLGSTNGTFLNGSKISGRVKVQVGDDIRVGANSNLTIADELKQVAKGATSKGKPEDRRQGDEHYPCIIGHSADFQPQRITLEMGAAVSIGREPSNQVQLQLAHISRQHVVLHRQGDGRVSICDLSSNGTFVNGQRLVRDQEVILPAGGVEVDLAQGVKFSVCDNAEQEAALLKQIEKVTVEKPPIKKTDSQISVPVAEEVRAAIRTETAAKPLKEELPRAKRPRRSSAEITRSLEILDLDVHGHEVPGMSKSGKFLFMLAVAILAGLVVFLTVWLFSGAVFNY